MLIFFGSIQIFNYLRINDNKLARTLWLFDVHAKMEKLFKFLKKIILNLMDKSYKQSFHESIKCHHNDIANYFLDNYMQLKKEFF